MLHGRREQLALLDELLDDARGGRAGVLVIRGEAGIGKSALLDYAARQAHDMQILRAAGVESESELPFAGLHQLLRPVMSAIERLPEAQGAALRAAIGVDSGTAERFLVSVAFLGLLAEVADEQPLLAIVDDAHWLDRASAEALVFAARRLRADDAALLFAVRDGEQWFPGAGVREVVLRGVNAAACDAVIDERGGRELSPELRRRVISEAAGNPLALIELPRALSEADATAPQTELSRLPLTEELERAFLARVRTLPAPVQSLLLLAACDDTRELAVVRRAARRLELGEDAVGRAERAGLLSVSDGELRFRHPLVRSAVHQHATETERRRAHLALADALDSSDHADRRAWHRACACLDYDEAVATELEQTAERAARRGGYGAAVRALKHSAGLTSDSAIRARRLVAAGEAAIMSGEIRHALALVDTAERLEPPLQLLGEMSRLRGVAELRQGNPNRAYELLSDAAEREPDAGNALRLLLLAAEAGSYAGRMAWMVELGRRASNINPREPLDVFRQRLLIGIGLILEGNPAAGVPVAREALSVAQSLDEPPDLIAAGAAALYVGDDGLAGRLYTRAAETARRRGALGLVPYALELLTVCESTADRFAAATAAATEGLDMARETGMMTSAAHLLARMALIAAKQGREHDCRQLAAEALHESVPRNLVLPIVTAKWALGILELGLGHPHEALNQLNELARPDAEYHEIASHFSAPDRVEAAVRSGQNDLAGAALAEFEAWPAEVAPDWALALAARCHALLISGPAAEAHFEEALALHGHERPFERARTELAFGEMLRRAGRRTDARPHLRNALAEFERLASEPWAERARAELRASGETARKRDPSTIDQLTPQELQIARLVADGGLSNPEIAARLFLSRKTVEYHLHKVYSKLGVSSRGELARTGLADGEALVAAC
jgi:DNA-binding CsgD family transcriptional regulator